MSLLSTIGLNSDKEKSFHDNIKKYCHVLTLNMIDYNIAITFTKVTSLMQHLIIGKDKQNLLFFMRSASVIQFQIWVSCNNLVYLRYSLLFLNKIIRRQNFDKLLGYGCLKYWKTALFYLVWPKSGLNIDFREKLSKKTFDQFFI